MTEHKFHAHLKWQAMGQEFTYKTYSRLYTIKAEGKPDLMGTAAPAYLGSRYHYNPEDMLVMSLSACHMLSYLAYAANSHVTVLAYQDEAVGTLVSLTQAADGKKMRFKEVTLSPHIVISKDSNQVLAEHLHENAHEACFIANSVNFPVHVKAHTEIGTLKLESVA